MRRKWGGGKMMMGGGWWIGGMNGGIDARKPSSSHPPPSLLLPGAVQSLPLLPSSPSSSSFPLPMSSSIPLWVFQFQHLPIPLLLFLLLLQFHSIFGAVDQTLIIDLATNGRQLSDEEGGYSNLLTIERRPRVGGSSLLEVSWLWSWSTMSEKLRESILELDQKYSRRLDQLARVSGRRDLANNLWSPIGRGSKWWRPTSTTISGTLQCHRWHFGTIGWNWTEKEASGSECLAIRHTKVGRRLCKGAEMLRESCWTLSRRRSRHWSTVGDEGVD